MPIRLNPFRGLPNPREVWAWGMYDLANQSFQLLINTVLFGVYVREVVAADTAGGERLWMAMSMTALLIIVAVSPIIGAVADSRAWKRQVLIGTGLACSAMTASLALVGPGMWWLAVLLYVPAAVLCGVGENFLGAFLPEIADDRTMGRISAIGWTMSYVGALLLMVCLVVSTSAMGMHETSQRRPLFVFAGLWFLLGILPTAFFLRERARPGPTGPTGTIAGEGFRRLAETLRHLRHYRVLARFLAIFFIYSMGTQVFVYLSGVITKQMKFTNSDLNIVALELTVLAGAGAVLAARYQDRWGHRRTIIAFLTVWTISMSGLAIMALVQPSRPLFFSLASGVGLGLGGIGTASRALIGVFTPRHKAGEFFGLWGMAYKLSGAVALGSFLLLQSLVEGTPGLSLLITAVFFGIGLVLMFTVDEAAGRAAARQAEQEFAAQHTLPV